jgi:hypothetical protein
MLKKMGMMILLAALMLNAAIVVKKNTGVKMTKYNDPESQINSKSLFSGVQGSTFDKSANGFGWQQAYNRKVQTNMDPLTGAMVGAVYRQLNTTYGTGTIGGMTGAWDASFQGSAQSIYTSSIYNTGGTPGGRYPFTSEFINGYLFGLFNDYDNTITGTPEGQVSQPMFVVGDATFGYALTMWSPPGRLEPKEGGAVVPGAWLGYGDVVYNAADGYYYWTTGWGLGGLVSDWNGLKFPFVSGRSNTPTDTDSWDWTDYNELLMDCSDRENGFLNTYGDFQIAFAKDIYGNGTGYGIIVVPYIDVDYVMTNLAGDTLDVSNQARLGYMYTTNWGSDNSTGDFKSNWKTPNNEGNNLFPADMYKLLDWYNTEVSMDSIGVDGDGNAIYSKVPLNWPYIMANSDVICTENNIVHVLCKIIGSSTEATDSWFYTNDEKTIAGYYDIVGEITDTGVNWLKANYIAAWMGYADDTQEQEYSNVGKLSIGYAGNGVIYASWWDRPETRYLTPPADQSEPSTLYIDDAFLVYSSDGGNTWDISKTATMENTLHPEMPYELKYAWNVTKTNTLQDEGWSVATHGTNITTPGALNDGELTVYAACQYFDPATPIEDPIRFYSSYEQYFKVWKITGTGTGIETEEVSMTKDFTLFQNYPNPFNPSTEIKFALQNDGNVKLSIFNTKGEVVANIKNEKMTKGLHTVNFDASALNSGVYFYKLDVNGMAETKKMVLTK